LVGLRVTQVEPAGVTVWMPASPWLINPVNVHVSLDLLAAVACELAGLTAVASGHRARLVALNTEAMRMARVSDGPFSARGTVVHAGHTFVRVGATVHDGGGRVVGHAIGTLALGPGDGSVRTSTTPAAAPHYDDPDPSERPAPADEFSMRTWDDMDPLEVFRAVGRGDLPAPNTNRLFGIRFLDSAPGSCTFSISASRWFSFQDDVVDPAVINTVSSMASGAAAMNLGTRDRISGEINRTVAFERPIPADDRPILMRATTRLQGENLMVCDVEISDPDGNIAALEQAVWLLVPRRSDVTAKPAAQRRLATVLFTDIVASTERAATLGDAAWSEMLTDHQDIVRQQLQIFGGREIKTTGDGFLATFDSPANAVQCARAIRDRVQPSGLQIRAGLHAGELEVTDEDIAGIAVHIASRILSACGANEILVSSTVRDLTTGSGLRLENRGLHQLKGLDDEWQLYASRD
jgi:class 3 adenylate cyclase